MKDKIVFTQKAIDIIVEKVHAKIDYQEIINILLPQLPQPQNGRDGKDLILTETIRADVVDAVIQLVPKSINGKDGQDGKNGAKGKDFQALTDQQLSAIAQQALNEFSVPEGIKEAILKEIIDRALFVTQTRFNKQMKSIQNFIKRGKQQTAGISGGDMIEEIDKAIGQDWHQGLGKIEAWITFNGMGVVSIYASANVFLLTDVAAGQYTITFANDITDENYAILGSSGRNDNVFASRIMSPTETNKSFVTIATYIGTGFSDSVYNSVAILR